MEIECVDIVAWPLLVILVGITFPSQIYNLKEEEMNETLLLKRYQTKMKNEMIRTSNPSNGTYFS